jgi:hypothetical protein
VWVGLLPKERLRNRDRGGAALSCAPTRSVAPIGSGTPHRSRKPRFCHRVIADIFYIGAGKGKLCVYVCA